MDIATFEKVSVDTLYSRREEQGQQGEILVGRCSNSNMAFLTHFGVKGRAFSLESKLAGGMLRRGWNGTQDISHLGMFMLPPFHSKRYTKAFAVVEIFSETKARSCDIQPQNVEKFDKRSAEL